MQSLGGPRADLCAPEKSDCFRYSDAGCAEELEADLGYEVPNP